MKSSFCFLLSLFVVSDLHSQNCKKLDSEQFFKSIKLGGQVPGELIDCSKNAKIEYAYHTDYRLAYDSLNQGCMKKYADLFKFQSIPFFYSLISANKNGQVINVELYYFFDDKCSEDSITFKPPGNFIKIFDKLVSLYGKPTRIEEASDRDLLFVKELGVPRLVVWECNNINLRLRVNYGSCKKELNVIDIQIQNELIESQ